AGAHPRQMQKCLVSDGQIWKLLPICGQKFIHQDVGDDVYFTLGVSPMKKLFLFVAFSFIAATSHGADEVGRYQVISLPKDPNEIGKSVVILDTKEGHLWEWTESPKIGQIPGGYYLRYQGKVKPGKSIGELIEQKQF
ncbi:MAG TPA: hypothetical protein VF816_10475, partial [Rhodocyclaceae bacterium]